MAPDGETVWRLPMLNIVIHGGGHIANGADNGAVWVSGFNETAVCCILLDEKNITIK